MTEVRRTQPDPTAAAVRAAQAEAWDEGATKASPYGGGYLRSLLIENPYRADRLACCDGTSQESASEGSDAHTDAAAPEGDCLAGPACVRLTTDGCRPVCGFAPAAPVAVEGVETVERFGLSDENWQDFQAWRHRKYAVSPVEPETSESEGGESRG